MTLTLLRITSQVICRICQPLGLSDVSSYIDSRLHLWQEHLRRNAVFFSVHSIRKFMILISLMTGGIHFEPLIKVVSARLLHYEASIFPLAELFWSFADITLFLTKLLLTSLSMALTFLKSSVGNSDMQPRLRTSGLQSRSLPCVVRYPWAGDCVEVSTVLKFPHLKTG